MDNQVELISDGDGLAVVGETKAVERFLASVGLTIFPSERLGMALSAGASAAQAGAQIASNSGRWVKLTKESATHLKKYPLTPTKTPGVSHAMLGQRGSIKKWLQIETPGAALTSPAILSGVAGIMAQLAMQQAMDEIIDYLAKIDAKVDNVLRAQTNQVLARLDGVDLAIREAMTVRESVGRVSEVTWSKVQSSAQAIHETHGYALRQLADLADRLEQRTRINELVETAKEAESEVRKWLIVLARCSELHDAVGVLELDRVLDVSPEELDRHRLGLKAARRDRAELIGERMEDLLVRIDSAAALANSKVLFNPKQSPAVVKSRNQVAADVAEFNELLGIGSGHGLSEAKPWKEAAEESWDAAREAGTQGIDTVKQFGNETRGQARAAKEKLIRKIAERRLGQREDDQEGRL